MSSLWLLSSARLYVRGACWMDGVIMAPFGEIRRANTRLRQLMHWCKRLGSVRACRKKHVYLSLWTSPPSPEYCTESYTTDRHLELTVLRQTYTLSTQTQVPVSPYVHVPSSLPRQVQSIVAIEQQ